MSLSNSHLKLVDYHFRISNKTATEISLTNGEVVYYFELFSYYWGIVIDISNLADEIGQVYTRQ